MNAPFTTDRPSIEKQTLPLVFDSPHSGRIYPDDFDYNCAQEDLIRAEDNYIDDLFSFVPEHGACFLKAHFPRTYIDVNRAIDDIEPELLVHTPPRSTNPTDRSRAGIGLIRRVLQPGLPVYNRGLRWHEIKHRIENYYEPYHAELESLINTAHYNFGEVWHINCHSMPSGKGSTRLPATYSPLPDFVLGDRDGTSCDLEFRNAIKNHLETRGFSVSINKPYKGVEILKRYGIPSRGYHSLQIEVNKRLYWDESKNVPTENYAPLKDELRGLVSFIATYTTQNLGTKRAAD